MPALCATDWRSASRRCRSILRCCAAAGLVREQRQGRFVNYEVDPDEIVAIGTWLARYRAYWPKRMEALADLLKEMDQ